MGLVGSCVSGAVVGRVAGTSRPGVRGKSRVGDNSLNCRFLLGSEGVASTADDETVAAGTWAAEVDGTCEGSKW